MIASEWLTAPEWLTEAHMRFLCDLDAGRKPIHAGRAEDRVRQKLRKAGLVRVLSRPRRWALTSLGVAMVRAEGDA